ncbi:hypothetical protein BVC80_1395g72 [Macleaya cordata]|uniref:Uncharacterized protein n=1 Tax=Macleaya cordata TaxID=56857 RepID=A0A200Q1K9_MACCD|nr:hypothetical protein BVC80_1395g72 [Macleaya cordata]
MADYGYTTRRFVPQENGYEAWNTRNNGFETHSDGWGKTGFASNGEAVRDHVCRPVIIDAQGRKRPIIAYPPENKMENFVTKTETIIEQVYAPEVTLYGNTSPRKVAPVKEYGVFNNGWRKPLSPERPPRVDEFISQVQTEASRPSRTSLMSNLHWRQKPHSNGHSGISGHGRNSANTVHQPHFDERSEMALDYKQEPAIITEGGWARPNRAAWASPTALTKPTNDIGAAIDYLKEARATMSQSVNMAPTQRRFTVPTPMVPKLETYSPANDNREALRRYGGLGGPQVVNTADTYSSSAIDSREAARRYQGHMM